MAKQNPSANTGHPSIILSTDNLEKVYEEMKNNGVEVSQIMRMPYGSMFTFKDQDNNPYLLRED